jgi:uncharacterized RDD family membrane protein YckC
VENVKYATFWQRFGAYVVDGLFFFLLIFFGILKIPVEDIGRLAMWIIFFVVIWWFGYFVIVPSFLSATLGKLIFKIELRDNQDKKPGLVRLLIRESVAKYISFWFFFLGYISMCLDDKGRTWHDKISKTFVVSKNKHQHKRSVGLFYVLVFFILIVQSYGVILGIKQVVGRENEQNSCGFVLKSDPIKTNHFDVFIENQEFESSMELESELFERAFDYVFWSISETNERVTRSNICLYTSYDSYINIMKTEGVKDWAGAYFYPLTNTIHFGPFYWDLIRGEQAFDKNSGLGTYIYHEITHYVFDNYFFQKRSMTYLDTWFNEGLAQHFSGECNNVRKERLKYSQRAISWVMMGDYYEDQDYTIYDYYNQSCLMVEFLFEKYGKVFPKKVIETMTKNDVSNEEAIIKSTNGKNYIELEKEWREWLKE